MKNYNNDNPNDFWGNVVPSTLLVVGSILGAFMLIAKLLIFYVHNH